ncbi:MAG: DUF1795 domain-containing protein [Nocardioides sp.]|nr:DUF1795 domain-containing protein [Nocardioides sp.]
MKKLANLTAAVLVSSLVLAGCGDSDKDAKSSDDAASQTSESPSDDASDNASEDGAEDPSADSSDDTDDTAKSDFGKPADGATVKGAGYSYSIPSDWKDITKEAKKVQQSVDTAAGVAKPSGTFRSNLNVGINDAPGTTLDQLEKAVPAQLKSMSPNLKSLPRVSIDGHEAIHHRGDASQQGTKYFLEQFATIDDDGKVMILTFSFDPDTKQADRDKVINSVLAGLKFD